MVRAGIEIWLKSLIRQADPRRVRFTRCVVTSNTVDPTVAQEFGVPVEVGGVESVRRAARDCDVMLISGPGEIGEWLADAPPPISIAIAHGDGGMTREIIDRCAPILDRVVAVSPRVAQLTCDGHATSVICNGVDASHLVQTQHREEVRQSLGFSPGDFVIGFVGRFSPEKRPEAVLQAVAKLPKHIKALMVGWGPMRTDLLEFANSHLPGRYAFANGSGAVGNYYNAMDAFCLVSHSEGYGLAIMEAMMCELPIIVSNVGFVPDAIEDRVNGLIVDGNTESIAHAAALLDRYPEWARNVARLGKVFADQHGHASRMARQYENLFADLWQTKFASVSP